MPRTLARLAALLAAPLAAGLAIAQTAAPVVPLAPAVPAAILPLATLAERARGAQVTDANGAVLGVVEHSTEQVTILRTTTAKLQLPASALISHAGHPSLGLTAQELDHLLAVAGVYQKKTHPAPPPIALPKGYVAVTPATRPPPPPPLATTSSKPMGG